MNFDRLSKSVAAGLCGSVAHSALMALKARAHILPSFEPYEDLQTLMTAFLGTAVHPVVLWALSYFNGAVVLGFLFGRLFGWLPGRSGAAKGTVFGLAMWAVMGVTFFPAIGKGLFASNTGLGYAPTLFTLAMVLTYSITLGVAYSVFNPKADVR